MDVIMEDDDNMILLVVEDEGNSKNDKKNQVLCPIKIQKEPLDCSDKLGNEIIKLPALKEEQAIKEEYDIEYLEEVDIKEDLVQEMKEDLVDLPIEFEADEHDDDPDYSDLEEQTTSKMSLRKRTPKGKTQKNKTPRKKKPQKFISLVASLRKEHREMAKDKQMLVEHLAGIMRSVKLPVPPANFCRAHVKEGQVIYKCAFCDEQRETPSIAARHYQFTHGELYLTCYACGLKYRNTTSLYKHEKRCPAPDAKLVLQARGHYLGRVGRGRPFATDHKFITAKTLQREKIRYYCTKCPASFVRREYLEAHENIHKGVRPYRCHQCTMAYTSDRALKRHLKQHGEVQCICDHCGKEFKVKANLIEHLKIHQTTRKHVCSYCARSFTQNSSLRHHINTVHLNLPARHGCPVCPKRYAKLAHVKDHMDRKHGLNMITRKMFFQALPSMTDAQVKHATKLFKFDLKQNTKPKVDEDYLDEDYLDDDWGHIVQNKLEEPTEERHVKTNMKENPETDKDIAENAEPDSDHAPCPIVKTKKKQEIKKAKATESKKNLPKKSTPKKKRKLPLRKINVVPEPPEKVDEEIDDYLCNIESKRKKKTVNPAPEKKKPDDEIVRVIKSTLTNQKKVVNTRAEKKKSTQNFYEIKREFMNQLKSEIEIPEAGKEKRKSSENLVPGTEIPENLAPSTKKATNDDAADDEEWKVYKDASEKNMVIAEFLEYLKKGVVPKHVPILRRGRQNKEK